MKNLSLRSSLIAGLLFIWGVLGEIPGVNASIANVKTANIPISKIETTKSLESFRYTIRKGDSLLKISKIFNTNKNAILAANSGNKFIRNENLLWAGGEINIPSVYAVSVVQKEIDIKDKAIAGALLKLDTKEKINRLLESNNNYYAIAFIFALGVAAVLAILLGEKISALDNAKKEIASIKVSLLESQGVLELKEKELAHSLKNADEFFHELVEFKRCVPGTRHTFKSREYGLVQDGYEVAEVHIGTDGKPVVVAIKCLKCAATDVKPDNNSNMNSHYWRHIQKELIDHA